MNHHQTIKEVMTHIGKLACDASNIIRQVNSETKNQVLFNAAHEIRKRSSVIIESNSKDLVIAKEKQLSESMIDRLTLTPKKIEDIAYALEDIAKLDDPVSRILSQWQRPNGLDFTKITTPIGVIGIIYESRPNVTADAGALAMKSGNACILRGGSESFHSSKAIHECLCYGLRSVNLPETIIQLVPTNDRDAVGIMLSEMTEFIDMIIPRGGKSLVQRIQSEAKVPVLAHLEGLCHTYIHQDADHEKAKSIILNAKMRRTGVCGATETLLVDQTFKTEYLQDILQALEQAGCEIRGCPQICLLFPKAIPAHQQDWETEYLAPVLSVKLVDDYDKAIAHLNLYSSQHTDAIITENKQVAESFLDAVDSAIVLHNTSTQFADGGEFGMGAEIGIATGKIHARGPVGLEQLCCFKYQVRGNGQIRPV